MTIVKPFVEAQVGDEAYTWENANGNWDGYRFETADPIEWHDPDGLREIAPVIRKKWRLIEVVEATP